MKGDHEVVLRRRTFISLALMTAPVSILACTPAALPPPTSPTVQVSTAAVVPATSTVSVPSAATAPTAVPANPGPVPTVSPSGAGRLNRSYVDAPVGWNKAWNLAKSRSSTTAAIVTGIGDSWLIGYNATNWLTTSWFGLMRSALLGQYPLYGDFWGPQECASFGNAYAGTPPWVINDEAHARLTTDGYVRGIRWDGPVTSPLATFKTPEPCSQIDVVYTSPSAPAGSTWTWQIDNEATKTVTLPDRSNTLIYRLSIADLPLKLHRLTFLTQSADGAFYPLGVCAYRAGAGGSGIGFVKAGMGGAKANDFIVSSGAPINRHLIWQGYKDAAQDDTGFGFPAGAALAIFSLGLNDCQSAIPLDVVAKSLNLQIAALRRATPECSVIVIAANDPDGITSDVKTNLLKNATAWPTYVEALHEVARQASGLFLNLEAKWDGRGVALGVQTISQTHPNPVGMSDIASDLTELI